MVLLPNWVAQGLALLATFFIVLVGVAFAAVIVMYIIDATQRKDAVRHNFPVLGRFRYLFQFLGEFFRQYFFAMDREEMPFNRAEREWVYRAAKNKGMTIAFGSTKNLNAAGSYIFTSAAFPPLELDAAETQMIRIGPYCKKPYKARSIINISGMSYGALSKPAVRALSKGAKMAGCWLNTGEGGLSPYHLEGGADVVFQIGTAKYGIRNTDGSVNDDKLREVSQNDQIKMFEVKLSQGAKPGKGGILPGDKVSADIARIRGIKEGEASISPNRHPEIGNVSELLDFINHVRDVSGKPVGFKTVIGSPEWLEDLCKCIHRRGIASAPDFITIDGGNGGTGAAPMSLMDNVGLVLKEALPMVSDILHKYDLRKRIHIVASGKLINPADVAWALCTGADFVNSGRGFMFALGCIQSLKCNKNTCPTGVATHQKHLQAGLNPEDKAVKVANYAKNITHEVEVIAHSCGVLEPRQLRRKHVRIVQDTGLSIAMDRLYPRPEVEVEAKAS
jgi:glutamate synthase domain-containing protein 2